MNALLPVLRAARMRPRLPTSLLVFALGVGAMAWLRLHVYRTEMLTLSYGLPLLACLWFPSRRLLWAMSAAFVAMATWKAFWILPEPALVHWVMSLVNIFAIAIVIHLVIDLLATLVKERTRLEEANQELTAREEEIGRQNEELQSQTEELTQQNEEIQRQAEELQQQTEELQAQANELHQLNAELGKRQAVLETLLRAIQGTDLRRELPERICSSLLELFDGAVAAVIREKQGGRLQCLAQSGMGEDGAGEADSVRSFAAIVMAHQRTAFVADLRERPDLATPRLAAGEPRSVLATPLRANGASVGSVEVYAAGPRNWTAQEFRIIEWAAVQCGLVLEVRRLHAELSRTNTGLDRLVKERTAELQEMVNELEHFSYTITHDLRAPLRAMHGFSELLAEECQAVLNDQSQGYLQRIATAAARMDRLITDALSFSKVMREDMVLTPQDPLPLLAGMIDSYPVFQPPRARITIEGPLPSVLANEAGLTQCFSNLLGNAVKFVAKDRVPEVRIRAEKRDGVTRLWFEDNGIGIPPEMRTRVFGMFQRLSKDYEGTGIGLALVKKVVERMDGRVGFESAPGAGSRFWIEFKSA